MVLTGFSKLKKIYPGIAFLDSLVHLTIYFLNVEH